MKMHNFGRLARSCLAIVVLSGLVVGSAWALEKHRQVQLFAAPVTFDSAVTMNSTLATSGTVTVDVVTSTEQVHLRSATDTPVLVKKAVASTGADTVTLTVAQLFNGIMVQTATAVTTTTTPTGAAISAALGTDLAVGDSFDFTIINLGGAGDIITFTAGATGVTITGQATVDDAGTDITSSGTWKFVNTAADTWIAYRIG